jgi:hypothetical protein
MLEHISAANSVRSLPRLRGRGGEGVNFRALVFLYAPSLSLPRKTGEGTQEPIGRRLLHQPLDGGELRRHGARWYAGVQRSQRFCRYRAWPALPSSR